MIISGRHCFKCLKNITKIPLTALPGSASQMPSTAEDYTTAWLKKRPSTNFLITRIFPIFPNCPHFHKSMYYSYSHTLLTPSAIKRYKYNVVI